MNPEDATTWTDNNHPFSSEKKRNEFKSPYENESKHNGRSFVIMGLSNQDNFDMNETGPYFRIQFLDGNKEIIDADPLEIYENVGTVGGVDW